MKMIPLARPSFTKTEIGEIRKVLESGIVAEGPTTREFEKRFANHVGMKHAIAVTSCTTALHLALVAQGIGPGHEVIAPAFTFPASTNAIVQSGAKPVLVDVDPRTYNIDPSKIEEKISGSTKAIMPVHLFGQSADMDQITKIASAHGLKVVEDAACGIEARYRGRMVGTIGDVGCYSFHPRKILTTGEGGMLVTNDDETANMALSLKNHGHALNDDSFQYFGYNYRLSDILAAIGLVQLKRAAKLVSERKRIAKRYTKTLLADFKGLVSPPAVAPDVFHTYQAYVTYVEDQSPRNRDEINVLMRKAGIETQRGTRAVHLEPAYQRTYGYRRGMFPGAEAAFDHTLTLPLYNGITLGEMDRVLDNLRSVLES
jgi:dTDP-4-amino-4,6-dideoxygalactose transaminase